MQIFLSAFNWIITASIMGSVLAVIILLVKLVLNKTLNAKSHYCIWILLLLRLIIPYVPQSSLSVFNLFSPLTANHSIQESTNNYSAKKISVNDNKKYKDDVYNKLSTKSLNLKQKEAINKLKSYNNEINSGNSLYLNANVNRNISVMAAFAWLLGVLIFLCYVVISNRNFGVKVKQNSKDADKNIYEAFNECKAIMKVNKDIPILITQEVHSPALLGIIKPKLLIPCSLIENITDQELNYILLHEISHYKRKDNVVNWISVILKSLHWFNPIIWYSFYRMRQDCELSCDASVLSYIDTKEQEEYGYTILHLLKLISTYKNMPGTVGIMTSSSKIKVKRRITMISNFKKTSFKSISLAVVLFAAIGMTGLTNPQQISAIASNSNTKTVQQTVNVKIVPAKYIEKNVNIKYPQIFGLVDLNKQKAINKTIKNDVLSQLNIYKSYGEELTADINYSIKLNNGKLLSIAYSGYVNFKNAAHPSNVFFTTNININNGIKIKLSNLVNINQAFVKKVRAAKYIGPLKLTKDVNDGVKTTLSWYTDADLTRMLKSADAVKGESFSYLTKDSLVVSLPMMHVIGDYGEFAIKYSDITNDIKTKSLVWKDILGLSK